MDKIPFTIQRRVNFHRTSHENIIPISKKHVRVQNYFELNKSVDFPQYKNVRGLSGIDTPKRGVLSLEI